MFNYRRHQYKRPCPPRLFSWRLYSVLPIPAHQHQPHTVHYILWLDFDSTPWASTFAFVLLVHTTYTVSQPNLAPSTFLLDRYFICSLVYILFFPTFSYIPQPTFAKQLYSNTTATQLFRLRSVPVHALLLLIILSPPSRLAFSFIRALCVCVCACVCAGCTRTCISLWALALPLSWCLFSPSSLVSFLRFTPRTCMLFFLAFLSRAFAFLARVV